MLFVSSKHYSSDESVAATPVIGYMTSVTCFNSASVEQMEDATRSRVPCCMLMHLRYRTCEKHERIGAGAGFGV